MVTNKTKIERIEKDKKDKKIDSFERKAVKINQLASGVQPNNAQIPLASSIKA
ncbi:MAG: hypothetical protein JNL70_25880 [Saprospiraceae bacterium]|nr:hypothetical protein [Saprospiraceae bacterium]